ncbi:MAG TPA: hypothetical protein VF064_12745 [Pyrinomonadaceae bacterium]
MSESNFDAGFEGRGEDFVSRRGQEACPACGAQARRTDARFCATCGRRLADEEYFPTDALLASYHQQRRRPSLDGAAAKKVGDRPRAVFYKRDARPRAARPDMFSDRHGNNAAQTAMAFVVYALVPYLGILFCPGALLMGGVGLLRARRAPHVGGHRASLASIALGLLLFVAHLLLWWILFKVPEWTRQAF